MTYKFSSKELNQFQAKGLSPDTILEQINNFRRGFPFADLVKPATPGDGVDVLPSTAIDTYITLYDRYIQSKKVVKFVPASGAASRMFKALFEYLEKAGSGNQHQELTKDKGFNSPWNFISNLERFAFISDLKKVMRDAGTSLDQALVAEDYARIIDFLVNEKGLGYGSLPKGLLRFHAYPEGNRVALEEHLVEAASYASSGDGIAYVHFTVSSEHLDKFREKVEEVSAVYEAKFGIVYDITFSVQKPSTDTVAVTPQNEPFYEQDGSILFRPGGHGALIENLGDIEADLVFIKNIDNVVPDRLKPETTRYKKAIGGLLLSLQERCFAYLESLEKGLTSENSLLEISDFAEEQLKIIFPQDYNSYSSEEKAAFLQSRLNRPMRICGMVKNEGEPGGGPFWIRDSKGIVSLQVVESSQIDQKNPEQVKHVQEATHFNPVDLVCATRNYKGERFDLHEFIDPETGFISLKSKDGKELKALELPGLWNGAMADWITIFVEVPIVTFNPVKTVNDLLRSQHQPE